MKSTKGTTLELLYLGSDRGAEGLSLLKLHFFFIGFFFFLIGFLARKAVVAIAIFFKNLTIGMFVRDKLSVQKLGGFVG